jgi:hypothetical protein
MRIHKTALPLLIGLFLVLAVPAQAAQQPVDVKGHWAQKDVTSAVYEGWAYIENGKFNPDKSASREEVIWMMIGACETAQVDGFDANKKADLTVFKDEPSSWAKERMAIAIGNAYIQGYPDKTIKAQSSITRAEFAVMLSRLIKDSSSEKLLPFLDKIPDWSMDGIKKVFGKNIIKGYEDKTFKPDSNLTKAEALVMIKRWKDGLAKPAPICDEYKNILSSVKYTSISTDHVELSYYGEEGKTSPGDQGKYFINHEMNNFYVEIDNFQKETFDSFDNSLKILIPNNSEKLIKQIQVASNNVEKSFEDSDKKFTIVKSPNSIKVSIIKSK